MTTFGDAAERGWSYRKVATEPLIEIGCWSGQQCPPLRRHFHDETQVSIVLAGRHGFHIGSHRVIAAAGQGIVIPAHIPHAPISGDRASANVINFYLADGITAPQQVALFAMRPGKAGMIFEVLDILPGAVAGSRHHASHRTPSEMERELQTLLASNVGIGRLARNAGRSREGYTRRFGKEIGMPPHAHRLVYRLNQARALLRAGEPVAVTAAMTGFADQSHFGRHFRRVFGMSPGAYRAACS